MLHGVLQGTCTTTSHFSRILQPWNETFLNEKYTHSKKDRKKERKKETGSVHIK